ncbi:cysteine protease required for autophagy [Mycena filopes]|nr:cysteine protease required for autophagy [Mycena filopes]
MSSSKPRSTTRTVPQPAASTLAAATASNSASNHAPPSTTTLAIQTPSSSPPLPPTPTSPTTGTVSKLPRFLQSPAQRDRSKSLSVDRPSSSASTSTSASSSNSGRKSTGRFLGLGKDKDKEQRERERQRIREVERGAPSAAELLTLHESGAAHDDDDEDYDGRNSASSPVGGATYRFDAGSPPPSAYATARPRTRSERHFSASTPPSSSSSGHGHGDLTLARTPSRLGADGALATRLSGWFAHLAGSTSDLSLTSTLSTSISHAASLATSASRKTPASPSSNSKGGRGGSGGGGKPSLLDKAMRYLVDGDAAPDRSTEEIWLMGVKLPGWSAEDEARVAAAAAAASSSSHSHSHSHKGDTPSAHGHVTTRSHKRGASKDLHLHPSSSSSSSSSPSATPPSSFTPGDGAPDAGPWPALFFAAFYAQVWCTYRAGFEPIRDLPALSSLPPPLFFPHAHAQITSSSSPHSSSTATAKWFTLPLPPALGGTKGWTADTGWGCMLRTGQSLLATALGRVGEPSLQPTPPAPFPPNSPSAHALHARMISWFLDAPAAPFGVHRMALAGKAAGKDVGMWFGPSAAAGALRMLVDAFPICGLGVSVATDGSFYQTEVFAASHSAASSVFTKRGKEVKEETKKWGDRPVLLLLGIKLGIEGVNPVYYETIKLLYTFPQSVGIAGGRPSSSYYFVGAQGDGLFYLDPHHSRPSVPLRPFLGEPLVSAHSRPSSSSTTSSRVDERRSLSPEAYARGGSMSPESGYARGGSMSPELAYAHGARGGSMSPDFGIARGQGQGHSPMTEDELVVRPRSSAPPEDDSSARHPAGGPLTPAEEAFYAHAYSAAELRTFHCERVRKMPMSGLDPSMLIGFLCRDEAEWVDLRRRVKELPRTIFAIVDEPPTWPGADDDDDMGLESISDPEEVADTDFDSAGFCVPGNDGDVSSASHAVSSASHVAASTFSHTHQHHGSNSTTHSASTNSSGARSSEVDTEEDPVAPITPLPGSRFDLSGGPTPVGAGAGKAAVRTAGDAYAELEGDDSFVDAGGEIEIEDDWVDPVSTPAPVPAPAPAVAPTPAPAAPPPLKKSSSSKTKAKSKKKAVPVPSVHYPFPVSVEDGAGAGGAMPSSPPQRERDGERERQRNVTVSPRAGGGAGVTGQRMHTARARDGGRTQSGGVRGVLTED